VLRRFAPAVLVPLAVAAVGVTAAVAKTVTGTQNPQFRVTVSITPNHPVVGDTIVARIKIVNTTKRTLNGEWQDTWSTPSSGIGAAVAGRLAPGTLAVDVFRQKVTATTPKGVYRVYAEADDRRGSSHARAQVTVR
jgi:hypothetical protein